ncbi:hypothetical protein [Mitsuaria sp. GD03876]|uniref:hypothetical protein n=1 Tax=Mitsuaria sp. GD03876 TaxID=2975399 RepID=UPI00244A7A0C|nr:hypothetical protein [Mitsuaria sp. GD03876]MDH0867140.1 hypothetical protein [Mitsuaria sp. GD03876]
MSLASLLSSCFAFGPAHEPEPPAPPIPPRRDPGAAQAIADREADRHDRTRLRDAVEAAQARLPAQGASMLRLGNEGQLPAIAARPGAMPDDELLLQLAHLVLRHGVCSLVVPVKDEPEASTAPEHRSLAERLLSGLPATTVPLPSGGRLTLRVEPRQPPQRRAPGVVELVLEEDGRTRRRCALAVHALPRRRPAEMAARVKEAMRFGDAYHRSGTAMLRPPGLALVHEGSRGDRLVSQAAIEALLQPDATVKAATEAIRAVIRPASLRRTAPRLDSACESLPPPPPPPPPFIPPLQASTSAAEGRSSPEPESEASSPPERHASPAAQSESEPDGRRPRSPVGAMRPMLSRRGRPLPLKPTTSGVQRDKRLSGVPEEEAEALLADAVSGIRPPKVRSAPLVPAASRPAPSWEQTAQARLEIWNERIRRQAAPTFSKAARTDERRTQAFERAARDAASTLASWMARPTGLQGWWHRLLRKDKGKGKLAPQDLLGGANAGWRTLLRAPAAPPAASASRRADPARKTPPSDPSALRARDGSAWDGVRDLAAALDQALREAYDQLPRSGRRAWRSRVAAERGSYADAVLALKVRAWSAHERPVGPAGWQPVGPCDNVDEVMAPLLALKLAGQVAGPG